VPLVVLAACGGDDGGGEADAAAAPIDLGEVVDYSPALDPERFVAEIDNPWLPLLPGARWVYEGEGERIEVVVTDERKTIMGIDAVVVRDTVTEDGVVTEDTYDWFAQDLDGNVWYLGEATEEYDGDQVDTAGSWEAGVDGALPGIVMLAEPEAGAAYRQELYEGEAEDVAEVLRVGDLLVIEEWNPLEPEVVEEKSYRRGVGLVLEVKTRGGTGTVELVEHDPGSRGGS
jgi:hypothetical protein